MNVATLRRHAVARSLFAATTLPRAIVRLGFVQADPIRAPARAQDLTLRPRVRDYRAGDLERRYEQLDVEEDYLVNYGFLPRATVALMFPREARRRWDKKTIARAEAVLAFVRERREVHPRDVDEHFQHGRVKNYWGGSSSATTHLLDGMHYRGLLRVARREGGIRIYTPRAPLEELAGVSRTQRARALVDLVVAKYAPLPVRSLSKLRAMLRYGAPQLEKEIALAVLDVRARLPHASVDGVDWLWPEGEDPARYEPEERVTLLAPFDPVVWDRLRFELLWRWTYRFEAYTPQAKRKLGYYALPVLWRDEVMGWANLSWRDGVLDARLGYVSGAAPRERAFRRELDLELDRMRAFLAPRRARDTKAG